MGSGEIEGKRFIRRQFLKEEIPIGAGADYLSMPLKRPPGRMEEVQNILLDKWGGYVGRKPYEYFIVTDEVTNGTNYTVWSQWDGGAEVSYVTYEGRFVIAIGDATYEECRITAIFDYQRNYDEKSCYIIIADNNVDGNSYKSTIFKVNKDGTYPACIVPERILIAGDPTGGSFRYFVKADSTNGFYDGVDRDIYWSMFVYTDPATLKETVYFLNGSTVMHKWCPDDPTITQNALDVAYGKATPSDYDELATPVGYTSGVTGGDWQRPDVADPDGDTDYPVSVSDGGSGYLNGRYFYKVCWLTKSTESSGTQRISPASLIFPAKSTGADLSYTGSGYTEDGIAVQDGYIALGATEPLPSDADAYLNIYRTKGDGTTFYYVATLDPSTTTYDDKIPDRDLGGEIPNIGDAPPAGFKYGDVYGGRLWLFNRRQVDDGTGLLESGVFSNMLLASDIGYPESYRTDYNYFNLVHQASTRKCDPGTGLYATEDYLLAFTEDSVWKIQGYDPTGYSNFDISCISRNIGCSSHRTIVETADGKIYWLWQKEIYCYDGYVVKRVARNANRLLNQIDLLALSRACAVYYPKKEIILLAYTEYQNPRIDYNDKMLGFYPETGEIVTFECGAWNSEGSDPEFTYKRDMTFTALAEVENDPHDFERIMMGESYIASPTKDAQGAGGGYIFRWDQATNDYTDCYSIDNGPEDDDSRFGPIVKFVITDWLDQGRPEIKKEYFGLIIVCKAQDQINYSRSFVGITAWMDGYEEEIYFPSSTEDTDSLGYRKVFCDKSPDDDATKFHEWFTVFCDFHTAIEDTGTGEEYEGPETQAMIGNMIKIRVMHNDRGEPFELVKLILLYNEVELMDYTKYEVSTHT